PTTALPLSTTDINGQTTSMEYDDPFLRPTKITAPNGQQTITEYGTGTDASTRFVKVKTQLDNVNHWKEAYTWADGLGRTVKTQSVESTGDIFVETQYDNMGRAYKATNPYRSGDTIYWTQSTFDDLGRVTKIKTLGDNAEVNTVYGLATGGSAIGTTVTV